MLVVQDTETGTCKTILINKKDAGSSKIAASPSCKNLLMDKSRTYGIMVRGVINIWAWVGPAKKLRPERPTYDRCLVTKL